MWKHVVSRLRASGATNVKMVWCPNHANDNGVYFENYYPGQYITKSIVQEISSNFYLSKEV
jgi:hypothetical protein